MTVRLVGLPLTSGGRLRTSEVGVGRISSGGPWTEGERFRPPVLKRSTIDWSNQCRPVREEEVGKVTVWDEAPGVRIRGLTEGGTRRRRRRKSGEIYDHPE